MKLLQTNVLRIMREKHLTQVQVARRGGISQSSVSNACRAARGQQLDIVAGLAKGLDVSISDLLSAAPKDRPHDLDLLCELYTALPRESRLEIMRVALNERRYQDALSKEK